MNASVYAFGDDIVFTGQTSGMLTNRIKVAVVFQAFINLALPEAIEMVKNFTKPYSYRSFTVFPPDNLPV